jgi:hypothetical protein
MTANKGALRRRIIDQVIGVTSGTDCLSFKDELYDLLSDEEKEIAKEILFKLASSPWHCWKRFPFPPLSWYCYGRTLIACATIGLEGAKPKLISYYRKVRRKWYFEHVRSYAYLAISIYDLKELADDLEEDATHLLEPDASQRYGISRQALITLMRVDKERGLAILKRLEDLTPTDEYRKGLIDDFRNNRIPIVFPGHNT